MKHRSVSWNDPTPFEHLGMGPSLKSKSITVGDTESNTIVWFSISSLTLPMRTYVQVMCMDNNHNHCDISVPPVYHHFNWSVVPDKESNFRSKNFAKQHSMKTSLVSSLILECSPLMMGGKESTTRLLS